VTGSETTHQTIKLQPTVEALGSAKTATLPAFHALTAAVNTGSFSAKGKLTCWKEFEEANVLILCSLANLDKDDKPSKETVIPTKYPTLKLSKSSGHHCLRRDKLNLTDYHQLRQLYTKP